jgi:hypothetical protein
VIESIDLPIRNRESWLGSPLFSGGEGRRPSPEFEVIAVNGNGEMRRCRT